MMTSNRFLATVCRPFLGLVGSMLILAGCVPPPQQTGGGPVVQQPKPPQQTQSIPNWQAQPRYRTFNLTANFQPDPQSVNVTAGGDGDASGLGPGCLGVIDWSKPDVDLNYNAGQFILSIWAESGADTTLVIYDPAGNWYCNDDFRGVDPAVRFNNPLSGNYNIWIGTFGGLADARLYITERPPFTY